MKERVLQRIFAPPQRATGQSPADVGLTAQQVWLTGANGMRLHAWFIPGDRPGPAVLVLHGWGANASLMLPLAPHLHQAGYHSLFLDARNHGLSDHDHHTSLPRFAEDLGVAADWLASQPAVTTVAVIGHSVGAGAAILRASQSEQFAALVAVSSPAHPGEMMRGQLAKVPGPIRERLLLTIQQTIGHRFEDFAPRNRIAHVRAPVLLIHGVADTLVPISNLEQLSAARPDAETLVVPDGGHSDLAPFLRHVATVVDFLDRHLRNP